jgi:Domain of unknown function (DUF2760)
LSRLSFAFRSFFSILFGGALPADIALAFGYTKPMPVRTASSPGNAGATPKAAAAPLVSTNDGAVQILSILQRDARLIDFFMEDISAYSDEQVGSAVRDVHSNAKAALERYLRPVPVIDSVEGDFTKADGVPLAALKFVGKVPPSGKAAGGLLRHRGWKAEKIDLPAAPAGAILAAAEIEVE